jgi:hypothetical protein
MSSTPHSCLSEASVLRRAARAPPGQPDGDGTADFQIELTGVITLTAADFVL